MAILQQEGERAAQPRDARGRFIPADPWRQLSPADRVRLQVISASAIALSICVLVVALLLVTPAASH